MPGLSLILDMNRADDSSTDPTPALSRRAALRRVVTGSLGLVAVPAAVAQAGEASPGEAVGFVPENDYPFFGYEPIS
jgi:hypothetical protein